MGYSLPKQLKDLAAAARADGAPVEDDNLLGDADSGRKFERKGLQTLLARAREGRVSAVYFAKVDRIGRNARDSLNIVHELSQLGVRIVVVDPRLDTKDPFGYFLFVILAAMAELEATFILERTMGGKLEQLTQDEQTGRAARPAARKPRYGFRYLAPTKKGGDGSWVHDLEEKRWVIWIYKEVAKGRGSDDVAAELNTRRVPSPGGARWDGTAICRIVRSTMNAGKMVRRMGGTEFAFDVPPMVPPALFAMANEALHANKKHSRRNAKAEYLLNSTRDAPLLKCRVCHRRGEEHIMGGRRVRHKGTVDRYTHFYADWHWEGPKKAQHRVTRQEVRASRLGGAHGHDPRP
jgi:DNA invertase Pin-like site-specific DNA recombinase